MKKSHCLFFLLLLVALVGCRQQGGADKGNPKGLRIVTSFYPIYSLVNEIAGEENRVQMIHSTAGIHDFEPSASDVAAIYDADLFVYHSRTLETWAQQLDPNLQASKVQVLEASEGLKLDRVEGLEDVAQDSVSDEKSLYDPHTWLDPIQYAEEGQVIADRLSKLDPKHEHQYQERAKQLMKQAQAMVQKYQPIFEKSKYRSFVTQHTAFHYLAKRFGLNQLGIAGISTEQEPSSKQLREIKDFIEENQVRTIFVENTSNDKIARALATSTGVKIQSFNSLEVPPEEDRPFLESIEENIKILAEDLSK